MIWLGCLEMLSLQIREVVGGSRSLAQELWVRERLEMAENLQKVPRRGILKQSTSFEQRGDEKTR